MKLLNLILTWIIRLKYQPLADMLKNPVGSQERLMHKFVRAAKNTEFGRDHAFSTIRNYDDFKRQVPLRNYEALLPYIERVISGQRNVLWEGRPVFLGKTSGTTSKTKYIPITKESLKNQVRAPHYIPLNYALRNQDLSFLFGKTLLFSDGHFFEDINGIKAAPISTITNGSLRGIYRWLCLPSNKINSISDYEHRIEAITQISMGQDVRTIVAMPVWLLVFLRALKKNTGKEFKELFPNFKVLLLSGMDYRPFLPEIKNYINMKFDLLEAYPSTEGFLAYQDRLNERGMQLVLNNGIFFEFIPVNELYSENAKRICLKDVELGLTYALILNTNAGLWGYINGDTVRFTSIFPHRIEITGRIAHYISAFGEHVTVEETDASIAEIAAECHATIVEYTVAPNIQSDGSVPYHEWFIEFGEMPKDLNFFAESLDDRICSRNFSYKDLVTHKAINRLKITPLPTGGFERFLKSSGRTGMQQKLPHAQNDYGLAQEIREVLGI